MFTRLANTDGIRQALQESGGSPIEVEDEQTRSIYVIIARDQFRDLQIGNRAGSDLTESEMLAVAEQGLADLEGWGAPGMDEYDRDIGNHKD